ncbi:MAG: ATP-binding protein [Candidatus Methanomethylophilaceae archaeon]|nr:ATP-binding protein [Candidatus Methanomethylophilaceae archaeon]
MAMKRKIYSKLLEWKRERAGSTALLIEGARRVGKSFIVEEFARNEYETYMLINFGKVGKPVKDLFDDLTDIPLLLQRLSSLMRVKLHERRSLIIFDEVQMFPRARESIKFLVEDGRYDYIETGSLISIHENVKDIIIPSEEEKVNMYPMDFEEFCWALGDETTIPLIREHFEKKEPLGTELHRSILTQFRKYMLVGGMPMAVDIYARTSDFGKAEESKRQILQLYREDISKKSKRNKLRTMKLFEAIPSELSKHDKRVEISHIDEKGRMANFDEPIYWLEDSMIANTCYNTTVPSVGLNLNTDLTSIKVYMGDTGLLVSMTINENESIEHDVYNSLLNDKLHINEGMFMENVVAQILRANGHRLFFHSFYKGEDTKNRYEVDFLVRDGKKIAPIEVKSSGYTNHSSLDYIMKTYSKTLGQPYILYSKDLKKDGNVLFLPLYMAICL